MSWGWGNWNNWNNWNNWSNWSNYTPGHVYFNFTNSTGSAAEGTTFHPLTNVGYSSQYNDTYYNGNNTYTPVPVGTISVAVTSATASDNLSVDLTGLTGFSISGSQLLYNGATFATLSGGLAGSPLSISVNSSYVNSYDLIAKVVDAVAYRSATEAAPLAKQIVFTIVDGNGNSSVDQVNFNVNDTDSGQAAALTVESVINAADATHATFTVSGIDDAGNGTVTFTDAGNDKVTVGITGSGNYTADLHTLNDGPITSSLSFTDVSGNTASATGNTATLDTDAHDLATLTVDPVTDATHATFRVSGIDDTGTGTVTFTDSAKNEVTVAITGSGDYTADLHTLVDGSIDASLLFTDVAGNTASATALTFDSSPCYCPGTLIRTEAGEVAVEELEIGDRVLTMSGEARPIKWIGRRSYSGRFAFGQRHVLPVCIKAGALDDDLPKRDLWISPHHAMFLEGCLIEAKDLVNGHSIFQATEVESVVYIHIELDSHDIIVAEGALSESFVDDDSRCMFHNAHEYRAMYPDEPEGFAGYCAPRPSEGYALEAARLKIRARAGLRSQEGARPALRGFVDLVTAEAIVGWAQSPDYPESPVCLDIIADGRLIGQVLADAYREDLKAARLGSGCHGFEFRLPRGTASRFDTIEVRRSSDGEMLPSNRPRRMRDGRIKVDR